tara:strand:- start:1 stop:159 length:159 start_codon:yes stop_codon:yes gene_type:complete
LPLNLGEQLGRVGLVQHDRAGRPAIWKGLSIQLVEQAGKVSVGKPVMVNVRR